MMALAFTIKLLREGGHTLHYKTDFQEIPVSVENRKGSIRSGGHGEDAWETKMKNAYGRIPGTKGADGDALDVYLGPVDDAACAYVVHQKSPKTGKYDEDKIFLGFETAADAKAAFFKHYDEPAKYFGSIDKLSMWALKKKLDGKKRLTKITESNRESGVQGMHWGQHKENVEKGGGVFKTIWPKGDNGTDEDWVMFDDPKTHSTFTLPVSQATPEDVKSHLSDSRKKFGIKESQGGNGHKKIVCFDFDGVLSYHESDWPITKIGKPLDKGFQKAREEQDAGNHLVVLTARPEQLHSTMLNWANKQGQKYGVKFDAVTNVKPPALRYYDDRAVRVPKNWQAETTGTKEHGVRGMKWGEHVGEDSEGKKVSVGDTVVHKIGTDLEVTGGKGGLLYVQEISSGREGVVPREHVKLKIQESRRRRESGKSSYVAPRYDSSHPEGFVNPDYADELPSGNTREARFEKGLKLFEHGVKGMKWGIRHTRTDTNAPREQTNVPHPPKVARKAAAPGTHQQSGYHIDHSQFLNKKEQFMQSHADFLAKHPELKRLLNMPVEQIGNNPKAIQTLLNDAASKQDSGAKTSDLHSQALNRLSLAGWKQAGQSQIHDMPAGQMAISPVLSRSNQRLNLYTLKTKDGRVAHYVGKDASTPIVHSKYIGIKTPSTRPEKAAPQKEEPVSKPRATTRYSKTVPTYGPGQTPLSPGMRFRPKGMRTSRSFESRAHNFLEHGVKGMKWGIRTGRIKWEVSKPFQSWMKRYGVKLKNVPAKRLTASESFSPSILNKKYLVKLYKESVEGKKPMTPVLAMKHKGKYEVQDGHHRARVGMITDGSVVAFVTNNDKAFDAYNRVKESGFEERIGTWLHGAKHRSFESRMHAFRKSKRGA
jgi:hypothetical protein